MIMGAFRAYFLLGKVWLGIEGTQITQAEQLADC